MKWMIPALALLLAFGCQNRGKAKLGTASIETPADAAAPSRLSNGLIRDSVVIPKGSVVTVTDIPANGQETAKRVTAYEFAEKTEQVRTEETASVEVSPSRAPDQTVALRREDNAARAPLLYAALASMVGAVVMMFMKYPTGAMLCGGAAGIFFLAWKLADVPPWLWVCGVAALAGAAFLVIGHEKGERAKP